MPRAPAHPDPHPLAGRTVTIAAGKFAAQAYRVEDWWDRVAGVSWMDAGGNPACLEYAVRSATEGTPLDDEVVYGKIGPFGKLVHVGQLGEAADRAEAAE